MKFNFIAACLMAAGLALPPAVYSQQHVGINIAAPEAALDVYGDLILRSSDVILTNGDNQINVTTNPFSNYRVTGPTAAYSVVGLSFSPDGKIVQLFNRSGFTMTMVEEHPATPASERIMTGTGGNIAVLNNGSISLQYDGATLRWIVRNQSAQPPTSGGSGVGWVAGGNHIYNSNSGNVGIGNTSPSAKLDVTGFTQVTNTAMSSPGIFGNLTSGGSLLLQNAGATNYLKIDGDKLQAHRSNTQTSGSTASTLSLNPFGGNVGIGTSMPEYKMHLRSTGEQTVRIDGRNPLLVFHDYESLRQSGFLRNWTYAPFNPAGYFGFEVGSPPSGNSQPNHLMFSTNYNLRMVILDNGNVGIGTFNPTYKLSVNGSIRSKEVVVESNWADYVFDENYKLPTLESVEQHIKEKKHLPGIPSAAAIGEGGLNIGATQTKMMEKIEELTLYLIEMKKEMDALKNELCRYEK